MLCTQLQAASRFYPINTLLASTLISALETCIIAVYYDVFSYA